jgi:hypothetical protein
MFRAADPGGRAISRRGPTAARLVGLPFQIPLGAWKSVSCECCVLSGRGLCDGLTTRPDEFYRVWCLQLSVIEEPHRGGLGPLGLSGHGRKCSEILQQFKRHCLRIRIISDCHFS